MPHATRRDQTLRAAARDFAYYLLRDLRDPVRQFVYSGGGSIPPIGATSAAVRPAPRLLTQVRFPLEGNLLTCTLLLFVTATFLLGMYFLPVAVVLSGGVKQVTTLPWHFTPKGALYGPIYGIYVG